MRSAADPHRQPVFFFNDTATTEIYTLSLHDVLPILPRRFSLFFPFKNRCTSDVSVFTPSVFRYSTICSKVPPTSRSSNISDSHWLNFPFFIGSFAIYALNFSFRSEEHTSELQSPCNLV